LNPKPGVTEVKRVLAAKSEGATLPEKESRLDQVVALAAVPILIIEARKAREGQVCGCC
jgi:hypothetical protein